jgi:hypothetical protein
MSFDVPDKHDYENVVALNQAWLSDLRHDPEMRRGLTGSNDALRERIIGLNPHQCSRLAETPFLLFSFQERDDRYWSRILQSSREPDLFRADRSANVNTLASAALGFIWQLARRNPYALRLFCGATLYWCERIAELTFYTLLDAVRSSGDVPVLRQAHMVPMWQKLLDEGISRETRVRRAAQFSALQAILTDPTDTTGGNVRALAVAEDAGRSGR